MWVAGGAPPSEFIRALYEKKKLAGRAADRCWGPKAFLPLLSAVKEGVWGPGGGNKPPETCQIFTFDFIEAAA